MKKIFVPALILSAVFLFVGCSSKNSKAEDKNALPTIILFNREYISQNAPIETLPEGYDYVGTLSEDAANNTGLTGCKMYLNKKLSSLNHVYVYQECEISVDESMESSSNQMQWAYVKWILSE